MGMIEREIYVLVKTDFSQICGNIKIINLLSLLSKILIQKLSPYLYIYASLTGHTLRFFAPYRQHPFSLFTLVLKPIVFFTDSPLPHTQIYLSLRISSHTG